MTGAVLGTSRPEGKDNTIHVEFNMCQALCNSQGMQGTAIAMNVETVARLGAQAVN